MLKVSILYLQHNSLEEKLSNALACINTDCGLVVARLLWFLTEVL